ncbi:MAG: AIPR family protein [Firmicutes bacterium]|nr:AIPR family protein [Bacillota bacterium]
MELEQFATDFQQDVLTRVENDEGENFREDAFTELMIEYLCENGELDDAEVCSQKGYGWKVSGYGFSMDEECLDLLVSHYTGTVPPESLPKSEVQRDLKRLISFFSQSLLDGFYQQLPESSPVFDLAYHINELKKEGALGRVRLFLLTDCLTKMNVLEDVEGISINGIKIPVSAQVWDIERLFRSWSSGRRRETIGINFLEQFHQALPCLAMPDSDEMEYSTYLALIPGKILYRIYDMYGPRLLERNVRSFLQARGSVNQAIRKTIRETPRMFLAYNNGISSTAEEVELTQLPNGGTGISVIKDFQIVNGGQTTASIYHAVNRDKAEIDGLFVQMKLTVLKDRDRMDDIVPKISESANTQNKVQMADFSANQPFHRKLEELSRTIWAPSASGTEKQTRWFYERARGQYADERARVGTPAKRREFEAQNPPQQKFTKIDLAKYEHTWYQLPHYVSEGAQKNFARFMTRLKESPVDPDQHYFEELVAKAILFKQTEKIVSSQKYGGYRANIVTYTLAWLYQDAGRCSKRIDLQRIWKTQRLWPELEQAIITVSLQVVETITNPSGNANVTEWCKKEACWKVIKDLNISLPDSYYSQLASSVSSQGTERSSVKIRINEADREKMERLKRLDKTVWYIILQKNRYEKFLSLEQEQLAVHLMHRRPKVEEIHQAIEILEEGKQRGLAVG